MSAQTIKSRRSVLIVPGCNPERFEQALNVGADSICIDLDTLVPEEDKAPARRDALGFCGSEQAQGHDVILRINSIRGREGLEDILAFLDASKPPKTLMLSDPISLSEIEMLAELTKARGPGLMAAIDSARGLECAPEIAGHIKLEGFYFGGEGIASDIGVGMSAEALYYARSRLTAAAGTAGIDVIDAPYTDIHDEDGLRDSTRHSAEIGMTGRAAIHPWQVPTINQLFTPSDDEIAEARRSLEVLPERQPGMHEAPQVRRLRRVVAIGRKTTL